jgi:hypothetical protein
VKRLKWRNFGTVTHMFQLTMMFAKENYARSALDGNCENCTKHLTRVLKNGLCL